MFYLLCYEMAVKCWDYRRHCLLSLDLSAALKVLSNCYDFVHVISTVALYIL